MIIRELIFTNVEFESSQNIFEFIADQTFDLGLITDKSEYILGLVNRENEISTEIGFDIAIPHCRNKSVKTPFISFIKVPKGMLWKNEHVRMIFVIGVPLSSESSNLHLKYLSAISRKLMHEDFREQLLQENDPEQIFLLLNQVNQMIGE